MSGFAASELRKTMADVLEQAKAQRFSGAYQLRVDVVAISGVMFEVIAEGINADGFTQKRTLFTVDRKRRAMFLAAFGGKPWTVFRRGWEAPGG